jgi:hypothetical protein
VIEALVTGERERQVGAHADRPHEQARRDQRAQRLPGERVS